jgi:plasmid stabilization system protein ParE
VAAPALPPRRPLPADGTLRTPQADSDLDDIWYYVATKSDSLDTADRLIDSIIDRFFLLASHPNIGHARD